jgi:hypothetical protein
VASTVGEPTARLDGDEFNDAYALVYNDIQRNFFKNFVTYLDTLPNLPSSRPNDLRAALTNITWKKELDSWSQTNTSKNAVAFLAAVVKYRENYDRTELKRIKRTYLESGWVTVPQNLWP